MRLVNPVRGTVVQTTDPRAIIYLRYNQGYWVLDDAADTTHPQQQQQETDRGPEPDPVEQRGGTDEPEPDDAGDDLHPGPLSG